MKKLIIIATCIVFSLLEFTNIVTAANPEEYTIPEAYMVYDIPGTNAKGTYSVTLNTTGATDPNGLYTFTVVLDTVPGEEFTKVTSWHSNFPVYAVIVKSNHLNNMYQYENSIRVDTDLKAPDTPDGSPGNVSGVTIVYNPEEFPEDPETLSSPRPAPWELVRNFLYRNLSILAIPLVVAFFLLGNLIGRLRPAPARSESPTAEPTTTTTLNKDNLSKPSSLHHGNEDETQFRTPSPYSRLPKNRYYNNSDK